MIPDIIALIVAPLLVIAAAAITKAVWDMRASTAKHEEKWVQNHLDHERAFKEISELKAGQRRIEGKVDGLKDRFIHTQ